MQPDIVGIGTAYFDHIVAVEHYVPESGSYVKVLREMWQYGGKVATGMAAASRLGKHCAMIAGLGGDMESRAQIADYQFQGVDTSALVIDPSCECAFTFVVSDQSSHERYFIIPPRKLKILAPEELNRDMIEHAKILNLESGTAASRAAAQWIRTKGGRVVMDADSYDPDTQAMLPLCDAFIPSEEYYQAAYSGLSPIEACREMIKGGCSVAIVTLGSRGCVGIGPEGEFTLPCYEVPVTDTTGAGDTFHGAFSAAWLEGMSTPEAARFASAVAAIKCMGQGGRSGLPTRETVARFMATGEIDTSYMDERIARYSKRPEV